MLLLNGNGIIAWHPFTPCGRNVVVTAIHSANQGATPCYEAACNGHSEAITTLHEFGADVNLANKYGNTPAMVAAFNNHVKCVRTLHGLGADINKANHRVSRTPTPCSR